MSKAIYWNDGRPVIQIGDRMAVLRAAVNVDNWRVWARRHGLTWHWGSPGSAKPRPVARVANLGRPDGSGKGLPDGVGHDARGLLGRTGPGQAEQGKGWDRGQVPVAHPGAAGGVRLGEHALPSSKLGCGSSSVSPRDGLAAGRPEAGASIQNH